MAYLIEGDYFEACNCEITCRCPFSGKFDGDACDAFFGWHITRGHRDGVELDDLSVVVARHRPANLERDRWLVELYIDERARPEQAEAIEAVFGRSEGSFLEAVVKPRLGALTGVHRVPIEFKKEGRKRRMHVGEVLDYSGEEVMGLDKKNPTVISNPPVWAMIPQPMRQARSDTIRFADAWSFESSNTNSYISEFRYVDER